MTKVKVTKKYAMDLLRREVDLGRKYRSADELTVVEPLTGDDGRDRLIFSVRYFGDWVMPPGETDDGDYDWKVPSEKTAARLDALCAKYRATGLPVSWNYSEKFWIDFVAE